MRAGLVPAKIVHYSGGTEPLSVKIVQDWLLYYVNIWPLPIFLHHARLLDRFLDWTVSTRSLPSNPLAELRLQYIQPATAPIVPALLSSDSASALEALRPQPRFGSVLGSAIARSRGLDEAGWAPLQHRGSGPAAF